MVALVVVKGWAHVPRIGASTSPGTSGFGRLVDDRLAPGRGKRITVPVVVAMYGLVCQF
jgi:hypothetical protein